MEFCQNWENFNEAVKPDIQYKILVYATIDKTKLLDMNLEIKLSRIILKVNFVPFAIQINVSQRSKMVVKKTYSPCVKKKT